MSYHNSFRINTLLFALLLTNAGCNVRDEVRDKPATILDVITAFDTEPVAGFYPGGPQGLWPGQDTSDFMLSGNAKYHAYYFGLSKGPGFTAIKAKVRADSAFLVKNYTPAFVEFRLGSLMEGRKPSAAAAFLNDSSGLLYWSRPDTEDVRIERLSDGIVRVVRAIQKLQPRSVDEVRSDGGNLTLLGFVDGQARLNLIAGQELAFTSSAYDDFPELKQVLSRDLFIRRKYVDSLLWLIDDVMNAGGER